jgi:hypothetical protein
MKFQASSACGHRSTQPASLKADAFRVVHTQRAQRAQRTQRTQRMQRMQRLCAVAAVVLRLERAMDRVSAMSRGVETLSNVREMRRLLSPAVACAFPV